MNREQPILFLIVLLLLALSPESNAFSVRRLPRQSQAPSPSPSPSLQPSSRRSSASVPVPAIPPTGLYLQPSSRRSPAPVPVPGIPPMGQSSDNSACLGTFNKSGIMKVCLKRSQTDSDQLLVLISNSGQSSLEVNVTVSDVNYLKEMNIPEQQTKQIYITANLLTNFTVEVDSEDEKCKIPYIVPPTYDDRYSGPESLRSQSYGIYILVVLVALIIGGCMASCYKFGEKRRLDAIKYQEVEMQQPGSAPADGSFDFEAAESWEDWDDKWDESGKLLNRHGRRKSNASLTGRTIKSDRKVEDGDDWDEY